VNGFWIGLLIAAALTIALAPHYREWEARGCPKLEDL